MEDKQYKSYWTEFFLYTCEYLERENIDNDLTDTLLQMEVQNLDKTYKEKWSAVKKYINEKVENSKDKVKLLPLLEYINLIEKRGDKSNIDIEEEERFKKYWDGLIQNQSQFGEYGELIFTHLGGCKTYKENYLKIKEFIYFINRIGNEVSHESFIYSKLYIEKECNYKTKDFSGIFDFLFSLMLYIEGKELPRLNTTSKEVGWKVLLNTIKDIYGFESAISIIEETFCVVDNFFELNFKWEDAKLYFHILSKFGDFWQMPVMLIVKKWEIVIKEIEKYVNIYYED